MAETDRPKPPNGYETWMAYVIQVCQQALVLPVGTQVYGYARAELADLRKTAEAFAQIERMASEGCGVALIRPGEYCPFDAEGDGECINYWHDPDDCGGTDFSQAVAATYKATRKGVAEAGG